MEGRKDVKTEFFFVRCRRTYVLNNTQKNQIEEKRKIQWRSKRMNNKDKNTEKKVKAKI